MKHFYMITNEMKDPDLKTSKRIKEYLLKKGAECILNTESGVITEKTECILVLGGDGTLLQAAIDTFAGNIPLIGVNLGTVGFLAEVEKQHIEAALDILLEDKFRIEERMMLDGVINSDGTKLLAHALNDVVVTRKGSLRVLNYEVYVNGQFLNQYHADGVIISTPTGSTGYNMSAGGPIVEPKAKLIVLTPICPHTLSPRSIILSAEDEIEIKIGPGRNGEEQEAEVNFDGSVVESVKTGDAILVSQSKQITCLVRINQSGFLETLHRKMS